MPMAIIPRPPAVGGMGVCTNHHAARERVVLEHYLVNDAAAGIPETDTVTGGDRLEEIIDLGVLVVGGEQVVAGAGVGAN